MILSAENYHSVEAKREYMSASRYKDFCGSLGLVACEAQAMAKQRGEWVEESTEAMLVSSYVDAHFAGTLGVFKAQHPDILKKDGTLMAKYQHMNNVIARIERDPYFMQYMSGQKQVIMTAEIHGVPWSIMIDSFHPKKAIVDLKIMADLTKAHYVKDYGQMSFVPYYGYLEQAAIYQEVVQAVTGDKLPFLIAAASKEEYPDIAIIGFTQQDLDDAKVTIFRNMERVNKLRSGEVEADRCEQCDWCRHTKILSSPKHFSELILSI